MGNLKLYKLINRIGTYWVIAEDPTSAEKKLMALLNKADYGITKNRVVTEIHLVAEAIYESPFGLTDRFLVP